VYEHVSEPRHPLQRAGEVGSDPAGSFERGEEIAVRRGLSEAFIRDDMRGDIKGRLDRQLERMLDEAPLAHVSADALEPREFAHFATARLDDRQLLGDELRVGHADRGCRR